MGPLALLHEDPHLVVVAKPAGLVVHRGWADDEDVVLTLVRDRVGRHVYPVHRLDRGTSGALVMALDPTTAGLLHGLFEAGEVDKRYLALVRGSPPAGGRIDHPIPRREGGPRVEAVTDFRRLAVATLDDAPPAVPRIYALVEATPRTGRLHQVRRHLKHLGHPLVGDVNYGRGEINRLFRERFGLRRLALHARRLAFRHPVTGVGLEIVAPLPEDLAAVLVALGLAANVPP